ncbi:TonB family protein [Myxococcus sp. K38C18041901]|uniref:TonB family protein n=1 Tax=Myxococcus guangdongensis TaxID=2906760 RepID=UPI0020A6E7A3|nr:TonB family protein [Myxococcus guangdongensis]MCP3059408.1 TonB family protein [Myxococcus guangdongensis]
MRFAIFALGAVLLGLTACGHSRPIPTLPASHGHLSRALAQYLNPRFEGTQVYLGVLAPPLSTDPSLVVTPSEAPAVFSEAQQVLAGRPTEQQVRQAYGDIAAACHQADLFQACDYLREQLEFPVRYSMVEHEFPQHVYRERILAIVVIHFIIDTAGRPRNIQVLESATHEITEAALKTAASMRFYPATLAGHPIENRYTLQMTTAHPGMDLTPTQELAWGIARVKSFPDSIQAWAHVARTLARDRPEDSGYEQALRRLNQLSPKYWWSATELGWLYAKVGRHDEAAPLARMGRREAPNNAYVLETSALVAFHQGRCQEAIQEQQEAIAKLPAEWPREEQERFQRALTAYQGQCPTGPTPMSPEAASTPGAAAPEGP